MNTGFVNGFSINGSGYPSWMIRAVAVAVVAVSATAAPNRVVFASATGDAAVTISLYQTHTLQAKATATANAIATADPNFRYSGACINTSNTSGSAAVRRDVFASAGGDARCYAEALTAQAIGDATAVSSANVVLAKAHVIFPGRGVVPCLATGAGSGDVTRYTKAFAGYGEVVFARGEASVRRNGTSFFENDGYVLNARAGATSEVPQDRIKIIATLGSFDFCDSTGTGRPFVRYSGAALAAGLAIDNQVSATRICHARSGVQSSATAQATGVRTTFPSATSQGSATSYAIKALTKHAASAVAVGEVSFSSAGVRTTASSAVAVATAMGVGPLNYGTQHRAVVSGSATSTGAVVAKQRHAGYAIDAATMVSSASGFIFKTGRVDTAMASALVGRAYAATNSEIKAPDERYMTVPAEDRVMYVGAEDRTMVVMA